MIIGNIVYASGERIAIMQNGSLLEEAPGTRGAWDSYRHTTHARTAEKIIAHLKKEREACNGR
jgi:hypothetical protein